ncbi:hypothetical protein Dxin01_00822 [Deinococcus xinjiangensis]|uniref:site-specific DNA-methyltransferase (adenine-specific) n=1 Tax=Deinococcus xinjiangensis TaxID=457454 RepID=A0ABP9V790_9DEIO
MKFNPNNPEWLKTVRNLEHRHHNVFQDIVTLAACVCACGAREEEYRQIARKYTPDEMDQLCRVFGEFMLLKGIDPFTDLFGAIHMDRLSDWAKGHLGEFYTPDSLGIMMAKMTIRPPEIGRTLKVCEPAGGSGGLILAAAQALEDLGVSRLHMQVHYTDLSPFAVNMALVNLGLAGIPALIHHGNTLTGEVFKVYETPAWRFAQPYAGTFHAMAPEHVCVMLAQTVPAPVRASPLAHAPAGAWGIPTRR